MYIIPAAPGSVAMPQSLCETCEHMREVITPRSRFLLCQISLTNPAYPKYPPQPIVRCEAYQPTDTATKGKEVT